MEFVKLEISGQSFMYHQIRYIIGAVVCVLQKILSESDVDFSFTPAKLNLELAPASGLSLKSMDFGPYNNSLGHLNGFIDLEASKLKLDEFARAMIYRRQVEAELEERI
ncbi:pseudouridylate synthase 1 homolog [Zophobas morio]|uniref:pseudouridylate synthase 1 homolog n=1 Tax=Zophobas morio TaxID=2755281 RepID=UPI00308322C4